MRFKTWMATCFIAATAGLSLAACSSSENVAGDDNTGESEEELRSRRLYSCDDDSDCVAIEKEKCCPNGEKIAVNENRVDEYRRANACRHRPRYCPQSLMLDERVAICNQRSKKCEMIEPEGMQCGGFTRHAHACPEGFDCMSNPRNADRPGHCERHVDPEPQQCGGIMARPCPDGFDCIDDPSDSCDPQNGGADCGGICKPACLVQMLCIEGTHFDRNICECVPNNDCTMVRCSAGHTCTMCRTSHGVAPVCLPDGAMC